MSSHLVLWDVDLTLVDLRGLGSELYAAALQEVCGVELHGMPTLAGHTERHIAAEVLRAHGVTADDGTLRAVFAALARAAAASAPGFVSRGTVLPGARQTLAALAGDAAVTQTVVTGNLRPVAAAKLAAFELDGYLELDLGGYGDLSARRADLVGAAIGAVTAERGTPATVTVFGDSATDVDAARAHGALAVGVATGPGGRAALADADHVLDDLTSATALLRRVHAPDPAT